MATTETMNTTSANMVAQRASQSMAGRNHDSERQCSPPGARTMENNMSTSIPLVDADSPTQAITGASSSNVATAGETGRLPSVQTYRTPAVANALQTDAFGGVRARSMPPGLSESDQLRAQIQTITLRSLLIAGKPGSTLYSRGPENLTGVRGPNSSSAKLGLQNWCDGNPSW